MTKPTTEHLRKLLEDATRLVGRLSEQIGAMVETATDPLVDGYPTSSLRVGGFTTGGSTSDPTGETATSEHRQPPTYPLLVRAAASITIAVDELQAADSARYAILERGRTPLEGLDTTNECVNCRVIVLTRRKAGRCDACYQYRRRTGNDRPIELAVGRRRRRG